ncbi:MAG: alcohol dehydrogenase catalytic domain-containing protein [Verrucomicrobia bacterium]|nr:alcohol dehydrogenase catalytic domain-containing protein [Verrucomicrobiota bacterium]
MGTGAVSVKKGDRVAVYLAIGCGQYQRCHSGLLSPCSTIMS